MKMKKSNPFPYGKFFFADFCGDQAKLDKNGQKQDGIRTGKMPENGTAGQGFCPRETAKNAGRHFLRPRYIEWRVWKRRGVEPMERKPDIDDLIFGDERPISQR